MTNWKGSPSFLVSLIRAERMKDKTHPFNTGLECAIYIVEKYFADNQKVGIRLEFEKWALENEYDLREIMGYGGSYADGETVGAWDCWQHLKAVQNNPYHICIGPVDNRGNFKCRDCGKVKADKDFPVAERAYLDAYNGAPRKGWKDERHIFALQSVVKALKEHFTQMTLHKSGE